MAPPMGGEPGARPFGAGPPLPPFLSFFFRAWCVTFPIFSGDDAMRNDLQFHMQVQHAAARVLANVERRYAAVVVGP